MLCWSSFHGDDFHMLSCQFSGLWLVSAICLGGCTHPVYPKSSVYFNQDLCAVTPWVTRSSARVDWLHTDGERQLNTSKPNTCMCVFICPAMAQSRLVLCAWAQKKPHSCINIYQVMFQTESNSSRWTVQGTNKNRQKTTKSLLTMQTALALTEEDVRQRRYSPDLKTGGFTQFNPTHRSLVLSF